MGSTDAELASMRKTLSLPSFATQTAPSPSASPRGLVPTLIGGRTSPSVRGLISETLFPPVFATQTNPSPAATPDGDAPAMPSPATFADGVILVTVPMDEANHTAPSPTAIPPPVERDEAFSTVVETALTAGSIRETLPRIPLAVQTAP